MSFFHEPERSALTQNAAHWPYHNDTLSPSMLLTVGIIHSVIVMTNIFSRNRDMFLGCSIIWFVIWSKQYVLMHNTYNPLVTGPTKERHLLHCSSMPALGLDSKLASATSTWWLLNINKTRCLFMLSSRVHNAHWQHHFSTARALMDTCIIIDSTNSEIPGISALNLWLWQQERKPSLGALLSYY